jgi:serine/threonine-protein kinase HipA
MAMAVLGNSRHYVWKNIQRKHFMTTGARCGLNSRTCSDIIDDLLDRTPAVIDRVSDELPAGFPPQVADAIFEGLKQCVDELGG